MKKYILAISSSLLLFRSQVNAMCPVCTVAVAAGVGLSRYLGIDDTITGIWIGGLTISMSMWTINWFDKKNIRFFLKRKLTYVFYFLSVLLPLQYGKMLWHPANLLWGMDKLLLGIILGSIIFYANAKYYLYLKEKNGGHPHFPFQKIVMSVALLSVFSGIFYYITTYIYAI